jgi:hypothetical protein
MSEADDRKPEPEERRFSQEQYDMLLRCSGKKDLTEWNEWREKNPEIKILLQDANLKEVYLSKSHLENANLIMAILERANLYSTHLEGAKLWRANLKKAQTYGKPTFKALHF